MILTIEPWIDEEELNQLKRVIASTYVTEGPLTREFEELISKYTSSKFSIAFSNGTMAIYAALLALNIGKGDEVIVPDLTFAATANAVILTGATPIFCDINCDNFGIDVSIARKLITSKTKAILPVHLYGKSCDINRIKILCDEYGLHLIEDAAQGMGVFSSGKHVGTFGKVGVLSFYGNKTITTGEGGICLTNDQELASKLYRLKNHGRNLKGTFVHEEIGFNFSFTDLQAAIGISQLGKLERIINKRYQMYEWYKNGLGNSLISYKRNSGELPWLFSIRVGNPNEISEYLSLNQIQARRFFYPLHLQPCYSHFKLNTSNYKKSRCAYESHISLPSSHALSQGCIEKICEIIRSKVEISKNNEITWCKNK
jgi:perosamine synthetase